MGKLTLHVDDDLITAAKNEAAVRSTSLSRLVSNFFRALSVERRQRAESGLPPITASLVGCIRDADADTNEYIDYLEEKHS